MKSPQDLPRKTALLVPDLSAVRRKFENPPPLLAKLYARFREQLTQDYEFRRNHVFLPALLGDSVAMAEAKGQIFTLAFNPWILAREQSPSSKTPAPVSLDAHIWCVTPRAMRLAVYFSWLDALGAWTEAERRGLGTVLLDFFDHYVVPVLRARIPAGHNQQFSMTFCSAVVGQAFAGVDGVADRARALRDWALPKFRQTLGLMSTSGYSGEGSTYQSDVVSALVMWAGIFLEQLGEKDVWNRRWEPNGGCLADTLRMEAAMGSCGGLLPPWDQYGWACIHNLAARTLWANLSDNHALLPVAESAWDEESFIAWRPDDRMWTLLYWPQEEARLKVEADPSTLHPQPSSPLTGWSLPAVGAAIEHQPRRLRVMAAWDACDGGVQGIGRGQVNPNHLMIDLAGEPLTADGHYDGNERWMSDAAYARTVQTLSAVEQEMIARQYGTFDAWFCPSQQGFLGAACAILVDGWESYFPRQSRHGRLLFERREAERHTFAGEASAYYQPAFDVTRMRRTVSMGASGVTWIVDDVRAASAHAFTWRMWLRRGVRPVASQRVRLDVPSGISMTLAWLAEANGIPQAAPLGLAVVPVFPMEKARIAWPDEGSERCDLTATGSLVRFVTCLVPEGVDGLSVRQAGPGVWEAVWADGSDSFMLPPEIETAPDDAPVTDKQTGEQHTQCDLDEAPIRLLEDESDAALLAALDDPPITAWRRTGAAMQTLAVRGQAAAMPKILALLEDVRQNYTVHSVAAWCLGHTRYVPARKALRRMSDCPEVNTAARARWAVELTYVLSADDNGGRLG